MTLLNPICVAIDTPDLSRATALMRSLRGEVGMVKLGLEFFYAHGVAGYGLVAEAGVPVFLDLKLHDIPNTVASALRALAPLKPAIVNLHAAGGADMMQAARDAVGAETKLIAVTVLTSLADADLAAAGFDPERLALKLAGLAHAAGLDGVVCSPLDVAAVRAAFGPDFLTVVPGIRPLEAGTGDQKRIATPAAARAAGADILVIGRPITGAADPAAAARAIADSLRAVAPPRPAAVQVKICGLSTAETLNAALAAGADFVGLVFYPQSPRNVSLERAAALAEMARGKAKIVALTVDAPDEHLMAIRAMVDPDFYQAHGGESPERIARIATLTGKPVIKAVKVKGADDIAAAQAFSASAALILYDAKAPDTLSGALPGGNGLAFDWGLLEGGRARPAYMLSGGLTPGNVAHAIRRTGARLVDVSSGVESAPGVKDPALIRKFIEAAKAAG